MCALRREEAEAHVLAHVQRLASPDLGPSG